MGEKGVEVIYVIAKKKIPSDFEEKFVGGILLECTLTFCDLFGFKINLFKLIKISMKCYTSQEISRIYFKVKFLT